MISRDEQGRIVNTHNVQVTQLITDRKQLTDQLALAEASLAKAQKEVADIKADIETYDSLTGQNTQAASEGNQ